MQSPTNTKILLSRRTHGISNLPSILDEITELGFDGMELALSSLGVVFGGQIIPSELKKLEKITSDSSAHFTLHAPLSLNYLDDEHIEVHKAVGRACIDIAEAIGASVVVLHPGWVSPEYLADNTDRLMAQEQAHLAELTDLALRRGTRIALENMPVLPTKLAAERSTYGLIPSAICKQAEDINSPAMTTCLDIGHAAISATVFGTDLREDAHSMAPHIGHLHLHDSFAKPGTLFSWVPEDNLAFGFGDTHLPLGWGNLDFDTVLDGLPVEPDTAITLEIIDPLQSPDSLKQSLDKARKLSETFAIKA